MKLKSDSEALYVVEGYAFADNARSEPDANGKTHQAVALSLICANHPSPLFLVFPQHMIDDFASKFMAKALEIKT